jgi:membrane protease subunit (stomatin/prohibitin family)
MALFGKNPNESAFAGGKKNWAEVIKNSGDPNLLIWRQPEEDFNTNSTLVVMPGEEAIFIKGGVIEQTFDNGTYKLSTENYPFISRLRNAFTGGISTFNCVVYFVRKALSLQVDWGTKAPMTVWDDMIAQSVKITGFGSYNVKIASPEKFLTKLIGNNASFSPDELENFFDGRFQEHIVSCIVDTLEEKGKMIFQVISKLKDFSQVIMPQIENYFDEYGIELENFSIINLSPEEEVRVAYNELMRQGAWERQRKLQAETMVEKDKLDVFGDDWGRVQSATILGKVADNPGAGGVASAGAGLGMGMAAGGIFGGMAQQMFSPMQQQTPQATAPQPSGRFAQKSTEPPPAPSGGATDDPVASLKKLKDMLDMGLIEQAEFDTKKAEIMSRM